MLALASRTRLPSARRQTPIARPVIQSAVHARRLVVRASLGASEPAVVKLTDELRLLETERDEAVKTAEEFARTAVKLEEMTRLLDRLALNKVQEGDEDGARQVLKEKASVAEVLSRTSTRATANYALASKLAEKIGQQQAEIMNMLSTPGSSGSNAAAQPPSSSSSGSGLYSYSRSGGSLHSSSTPPTSSNTDTSSSGYAPSSSTYTSSNSSSSQDSSSSSYSSSGGYEPPWEQSLREARARVSEAEAAATAAGQAAGYRAKESLEEARERLRRQALESVTAARSRIYRSASESIAEAQARIAADDAAALAEVHKVIDRYKAGGYVPDAELDWAFAQLEKRSWRS